MDAEPGRGWWYWRTRLLLGVMHALGRLPLPVVRGIGAAFGLALHTLAPRRRRIARTNWMLCFPQSTQSECQQAVREHFMAFAQSWLDRAWLWSAPLDVLQRRLTLVGEVEALRQTERAVVFAPHFVGLDAGWTALTVHMERRFCGIYAHQLNPEIDRWIFEGRSRFGNPGSVANHDGVKPMVTAIRSGLPLYLLPDMDHGVKDSVFVPFFGVPTATLTALPRFARLGRAKVIPVTSRLTPEGYEIRVWPAWDNYPTDDVTQDVALMNERLQHMIETMPQQYYWVHKRFKTRPPGEPPLYQGR